MSASAVPWPPHHVSEYELAVQQGDIAQVARYLRRRRFLHTASPHTYYRYYRRHGRRRPWQRYRMAFEQWRELVERNRGLTGSARD
jgi:hypothetical protein